VGEKVVARSDRSLGTQVAGAAVGLVRLPIVADYVPERRSAPAPIGQVGKEIAFEVPDLPAGLYEAVVSCPRCTEAANGQTLFPAGSILVTAKQKTSAGIRIVSYGLTAALVLAALLAIVVWRRRRRLRADASRPGSGGS
jgi:MYXO-CTERM domain-containing protein